MSHQSHAKDWAKEHMKGLWTSPMYPFKSNNELDESGIKNNVEYMIAVKSAGIGFGFSEPWVVSRKDRMRAMAASVDAVNKRVPAYLHTTDHSVEETIELTQYAKNIGADAVMIWPPYEWAKTQEMICDYYEYVASKVNIPIFLYNTYHSGINMSPQTIERLSRIPNVCALKDAVNDRAHTAQCFDLCGNDIVVNDPLEEHLIKSVVDFNQQLLLGTTAVFLMQSPTCQPIQDYFDLARQGNIAEASKKFEELQPLRDVWTQIYQVLWDKKGALHPLPFIKYWMDLIGMSAGPVRQPMHNLSDEQKADFRKKLCASGWVEKLWPDRVKYIETGL